MSDAVLAFEIYDNDAAEAALKFVLFMDLRIANGSNGVVKASETFFALSCLNWAGDGAISYDGLLLRWAEFVITDYCNSSLCVCRKVSGSLIASRVPQGQWATK